MSQPHKCPVCEGSGKVIDAMLRQQVACHACGGRGVLWEQTTGPQEAAVGGGDPRDITGL